MKLTTTAITTLFLLAPLKVLAQEGSDLPNPAIATGPALSEQSSLVSSVYSASSMASTLSASAAASASEILSSASSAVGGSATDASESSVLSSASAEASSVLSSASSSVSEIASSVLSAASSGGQYPMATAGAVVGAAALGFAVLL